MGVTVAVTRVACNTSTGDQTITTTDLGGLTPKAAIFIATYATTDGTAADEAVLSYGMTDGTTQFAIGVNDEHGQANSDTARFAQTDEVVLITTPGLSSVNGEAAFSAWVTNGVTINWGDAPTAAFLLTVMFFAGTDLSAYVGTQGLIAVDTATDITAVGFEADVVLSATHSVTMTTGGNNLVLSRGMVHNDRASGITQRSTCHLSLFNKADGQVISRCTASYGLMSTLNGTLNWGMEFTAFDSSGFTVTPRTSGSEDFGYLALRFGATPAVESWVGTYSTPTATGSDSDTGPGFKPQALLMFTTFMEAVDTGYTDGNAGANGFSVIDADEAYSDSTASEDASANMDTQSLSDNVAVQLPDHDGSAGLTATFTSFDATGWTFNYSAVEAAAKLFFVLAIEEEAAGGVVEVQPPSILMMTGVG